MLSFLDIAFGIDIISNALRISFFPPGHGHAQKQMHPVVRGSRTEARARARPELAPVQRARARYCQRGAELRGRGPKGGMGVVRTCRRRRFVAHAETLRLLGL